MTDEVLEHTLALYGEEIQDDCRMDQLNVKEKVGCLATIRHKWVGRLIRAKRDTMVLERQKAKIISDAVDIAKQRKHPVEMSTRALAASCATQPTIIAINTQIDNLSVIIEYLEKVEKVFQAMGHDARNLVDLIKLETL